MARLVLSQRASLCCSTCASQRGLATIGLPKGTALSRTAATLLGALLVMAACVLPRSAIPAHPREITSGTCVVLKSTAGDPGRMDVPSSPLRVATAHV